MTDDTVTRPREQGLASPAVDRSLNNAVGGVCLVVGAVVFCTVRLIHGDTPAGEPEASLAFVHSRPSYASVHVIAVLAMLLTVTGLMAAARTIRRPSAGLAARSAVVAAVAGWAVFTIESTSEGLALPVLADQAAGADAATRSRLAEAARAVAEGTYGPSLMGMAVMIGIPLLLLGVAMALDADAPTWLGWIGAAVGGLTFAVAVGIFLKNDLMPGVVLYGLLGSVVAQLWLVGVGVWLLRTRRAE